MSGYADAYTSILSDLILSLINRTTTTHCPITVTLTWDMRSDIELDLHLFEPNFHVFNLNKTGQNGFLDVNKSRGFFSHYRIP